MGRKVDKQAAIAELQKIIGKIVQIKGARKPTKYIIEAVEIRADKTALIIYEYRNGHKIGSKKRRKMKDIQLEE